MKKSILLIMGLFFIGLSQAQVGINTRSPQGIFHIDGRGDTNGNLNVSDDVSVDKYGNIGIGTTTPQKKLHIESSTSGAIRIADTSQGAGKVLTSSLTGEASWIDILGSWNGTITGGNLPYTAALGERKIIFTSGTLSKPGVGYIDIVNSTIAVPYTGSYRLTLFGTSLMNRAAGYFIAGYYDVRVNGTTSVWSPHSLGYTKISSSPYVSYYTVVYLTQNSTLSIFSMEQSSSYANAVSNLTLLVEFIK